jgi:hypothetical protein
MGFCFLSAYYKFHHSYPLFNLSCGKRIINTYNEHVCLQKVGQNKKFINVEQKQIGFYKSKFLNYAYQTTLY